MNRRFDKTAALALCLLVSMTACDRAESKNDNHTLAVDHVTVDGRTIACVYYVGQRSGTSLSCDWAPR